MALVSTGKSVPLTAFAWAGVTEAAAPSAWAAISLSQPSYMSVSSP